MWKKIGALAAAAVVGIGLVPATNADAKSAPGHYVGCYRTSKKGNYNDVRLGLQASIKGTKVSAFANEMVAAECQRVNSLPIIHMKIYWVLLSVESKHVSVSKSVSNGGTKGAIHVYSPAVTVACGKSTVIYAKVSFDYYNGVAVRPFVIHSRAFKRC